MKVTLGILLTLLAGSILFAQGHLILSERVQLPGNQQMELRSTDARVNIRSGVATVTVEQVFYNPSSQRLEGEYVFFLPGESQVYDFNLYMDKQKVAGQVLDGKEAYETYKEIVRKMKDPALLEYAGSGLFKAQIFPIEPRSERKIELTYANILDFQSRNFRFRFPVFQTGSGSNGKLHLQIAVREGSPLENIYSPTHQIQIQRNDPQSAQISVETGHPGGEKEFVLFYTLADSDIACSLISFRPRTDRDGYFMLLLSPALTQNRPRQISRDVIFVTDVSGSMQGEKIIQARDALKFCVNALNSEDRFDIISFSSTIQFFKKELQRASQDTKQNALYFIDNLSASGGTNINQALREALALKVNRDGRATEIIFLTDGLPTEGETDIQRIIQTIQDAARPNIRIFAFGVGYDVNTFLLDKIAQDTRGSADYVKPGESIETTVSTFFAKISSPVLTDIRLDFGSANAFEIYPVQIPDIFMGGRITILGRYRKTGQSNVQVTGKEGGTSRRFDYRISFENREQENEFIAKLWANRKVQHLMTEIRFKGENPELVESIKSLGKEYGIVTPYTSYLVLEQQKELEILTDQVRRGSAGAARQRIVSEQKSRDDRAANDEESLGSESFYQAITALPAEPQASSGQSAVHSSRVMKKMKESDKAMDMILTMERIADRAFYLRNGIWWEEEIRSQTSIDREIQFLSEEYFSLLEKNRDLKKILALGENVVFKLNGKVVRIVNK